MTNIIVKYNVSLIIKKRYNNNSNIIISEQTVSVFNTDTGIDLDLQFSCRTIKIPLCFITCITNNCL